MKATSLIAKHHIKNFHFRIRKSSSSPEKKNHSTNLRTRSAKRENIQTPQKSAALANIFQGYRTKPSPQRRRQQKKANPETHNPPRKPKFERAGAIRGRAIAREGKWSESAREWVNQKTRSPPVFLSQDTDSPPAQEPSALGVGGRQPPQIPSLSLGAEHTRG